MRRRPRNMWPQPKGPVAFPVNGRQAVPLLNQGNTIKRVDLVRSFVAPVTITQPEPILIVTLGMVRSDGRPITIDVWIPISAQAPAVIHSFGEGLKMLQTFLNCSCEPNAPCVHHAPKAAAATPSGIVLTDVGAKTEKPT